MILKSTLLTVCYTFLIILPLKEFWHQIKQYFPSDIFYTLVNFLLDKVLILGDELTPQRQILW